MATGGQCGRERVGAAAVLGILLVMLVCPAAMAAEGGNPGAPEQAREASGPELMTFQGDLRDGASKPLNGTYDMVFRLFDSSTGGTLLLADSHSAPGGVIITEGLFDTLLGGGALTPGSQPSLGAVFANFPSVWLEIQVGSETLSPRMQVTCAAYAQNASALDGRGPDAFAAATHGHVGSDITGPVAEATVAGEAANADTLDGQHAEAFAAATHAHDAAAITTGVLPASRGGTGLASPGASGNLLTSNGSAWTSSTPPTAASTGAVVDAANSTLTRSGAGTAGSPFKLALNLGSANTWSGAQTFSTNTYFPGPGIWTSSGTVGIGTAAPASSFTLDVRSSLPSGIAVQGIGPGAGGYFKDSDDGGFAEVGVGGTGIDAEGKDMGGAFYDFDGSGTAFAGYGDRGIEAQGNEMGGYFKDKDGSGYAKVGYGDRGIEAYGNLAGGYFKDADNSGVASVGAANHGIDAFGNETGGYFKDANSSGLAWAGYGDIGIAASGNQAGGFFADTDNGAYAWVGVGDSGIDAYGNSRGGYFKDMYDSGYAYVAIDNYGIQGFGTYAGGHFDDLDNSSWADVSYGTYKIYGSGTVSFVQNHPSEKDRVIVYACPEGDEVATYTRGTGRLVNGEARVALGETFKWVTNPDVGLTVNLTPRGKCRGLYVDSLSTSEMVVRELEDGASDAAFDYLVFGLRIGFEESSIVQEKRRESFIPSFKDHRESYSKNPELRAFNALERFKAMQPEAASGGVLDLSRAEALRASIHEYDPATDPPVHELFGHGPGPQPSPVKAGPLADSQVPEPVRPASPTSASGVDVVGRTVSNRDQQAPPPSLPASLVPERFPVCESVEAGDVLVSSAAHPAIFCLGKVAADPKVIGLSTGSAATPIEAGNDGASYPLVPIATSGIVTCKVDAAYGPIAVGDLLTTSPTPGHAQRAGEVRPGTIVGKALEPLDSGTGVVRILVMLR